MSPGLEEPTVNPERFFNGLGVNSSIMSRVDLEYIRGWAIGKLATGGERRRDDHRAYMALRQTIDAILAGEGKPLSGPWRDKPRRAKPNLKLVWSR
jgi:hypothetical protein